MKNDVTNLASKYAVVEVQWHQYIVREWESITVDRLESDTDIALSTLLIFDPEAQNIQIGSPFLESKVMAKVIDHSKGEKIRVLKFHRKNRYERNYGFRPYITTLEIISIA